MYEVVDASGRGVPHARLWLSRRFRDSEGYVIGQTDGAGHFELTSMTQENALGARAPGFAPSTLRRFRGRPGDRVAVQLVLDRVGAEATGQVVDASGAPVPGARLTIGRAPAAHPVRRPDGFVSPGAAPVRCTTDREGRFRSPFVALGHQPVEVRARGFAHQRGVLSIDPDMPAPVRIVLVAESAVFGRVLGPSDAPVPFARVSVRDGERLLASSFAGADGSYRVRALPAGPASVVAQHDEWGQVATELVLAVGQERLWEPVLSRSPRIFGHLTSADGEQLEEWSVAIRPASARGGRGWISYQTQADGAFTFANLEETTYLVYVNAPRGGWREFPRLIHGAVDPSQEPLALELPGLAARGRIVGTVLDPARKPAQGVLVTVWHHEQRLWREYPTDPETGAFEIAGVPPGTCTLEIRSEEHPWMRLGEQSVAAGDVLDLGTRVFEPSGALTGTLDGGDDGALDSLVFVVVDAKGAENGVVTRQGRTFTTGPLAPGRYELLVRGDFLQSVRQHFEVRAGEDTELGVELVPCGLRRVLFELPEGVPEPAWLMSWILDAVGQQPWMSGNVRRQDGRMVARISAAAGTYRLGARANNGWHAEAELVIGAGPGEGPALTLELVPPADPAR